MSSEMDEVINEYIAECKEMMERLNERISVLDRGDNLSESLRAIARDLHTIKGNSQLFGFLQVGQIAHAMEECLQRPKDTPVEVIPALVDVLLSGLDVISKLFASIKSTGKEPPMLELVNNVSNAITAFSNNKSGKSQITRVPEPGSLSEQIAVQEAHQKIKVGSDDGPSDTIRVQVEILDKLMNLAGELVLIRNQLSQFVKDSENDHLTRMNQRLHIVSSELQNEVMKTRMQPIGNILGKFTRIVRDTARSIGKSADLSLSGVETELDKTLIEAIRDPLTHIVRNAVDHGIEAPADRKKANKPEQGLIAIRAYHEGGYFNVEISDDGRGLSRMKIGSKAIEKGLMTPETLAKMSDREIYPLIFYPGFSTASKVSNLSGRGVGMDVVKTNIEKVGGSIEIHSASGKGTTFKLRIPLTLAIVQALVVRSGGQRFAIPQANLSELVRINTNPNGPHLEMLQGHPVYRLRGKILPLIYLDAILDLRSLPNEKNNQSEKKTASYDTVEHLTVAILKAGDLKYGLIIDEIEDSADIVMKPIPTFLRDIAAYSGATILGDGGIALTIDTTRLAELAHLEPNGKHFNSDQDPHQGDLSEKLKESTRTNQKASDYLRIDLKARGSFAIPLEHVSRLEEIPSAEIQTAGKQQVVKYRGALLPLLSIAKALNLQSEWPIKDKVSTVVIRQNSRLYGLVVNQIIDIFSSFSPLDEKINKKDGLLGAIIDSGEVVSMIDTNRIIQKHFHSQIISN